MRVIANRHNQDVPAFHVVAGNPAKILRKIETSMDPEQNPSSTTKDGEHGAEIAMAEMNSH